MKNYCSLTFFCKAQVRFRWYIFSIDSFCPDVPNSYKVFLEIFFFFYARISFCQPLGIRFKVSREPRYPGL